MASSLFTLFFSGWLFTAVLMALLWLLQRARQDASHVNVAWAASLGLLACFYAVMADGDASRRLFLAALAGVLAFRLTLYLFVNRVWGKPGDGRYQNLRQQWNENAQKIIARINARPARSFPGFPKRSMRENAL